MRMSEEKVYPKATFIVASL